MIEKRRVPLLLIEGTNVKRHPVDARRERPVGQIPDSPVGVRLTRSLRHRILAVEPPQRHRHAGRRLAARGIEDVRRNRWTVSVGHAQDPLGNPDVHGATRGAARAENGGCDSQDAAAQVQDSPLPLERRVNVDSHGRQAARARFRESHQPSRTGHAAAVSGRDQRDRAALSLWIHDVREQGRATGRKPLRDTHAGPGTAARNRPADPLGRRAGHHYRRSVTAPDLVIRGGTAILPTRQAIADIAITDGTISAIGSEVRGGKEVIDASGLVVLPGVVDAHVHFNEPGRADWEGWDAGTRGAAAGGVTTVLEMPLNAHPPTTTAAAFDQKLAVASRKALVDFGLWGGLVPDNLESLQTLHQRGVVGFKAFMSHSGIDDFQRVPDRVLAIGLKATARFGAIVGVHAESQELLDRWSAEQS